MADELETIIRTTLQAKILTALKEAPEAIDAMIEAALSKPINEDGTNSHWGTKIPYLEYIAGETIRDAARRAVVDVIAEMAPAIKDTIRTRLSATDMVDAFAKALVDASVTNDWKIKVVFGQDKDR